MEVQPNYSRRQLAVYFLKLGSTGFGGPIALVGHMHKDLVENRRWISEEEFKQGLALAQLAPGPLAAQLGIYIGFVHYRLYGATLAGLAFVLPSFLMVVLLGAAYRLYGGLQWMQAVFYGVGASVIGIIANSCYKLITKSVGNFNVSSFTGNPLPWVYFFVAAAITYVTEEEKMLLFLFAGLIYMFVKAPPKWLNGKTASVALFLQIGLGSYRPSTLESIAFYFAKAGAFVFGSGLAIVPFLHAGVVSDNHWLSEQQFIDAVAVAMITPGPVVITVAFIGYLVAGFPGACVAALATFLPCYLFTVLPAPYFKKIASNRSIKAFVDGITAAVVGALAGSVIIIAVRSIVDLPTACIALTTICVLIYLKKIPEPYLIAAAAFTGIVIKLIL